MLLLVKYEGRTLVSLAEKRTRTSLLTGVNKQHVYLIHQAYLLFIIIGNSGFICNFLVYYSVRSCSDNVSIKA